MSQQQAQPPVTPDNSVTRAARTVSLAVFGSRILGLVREQVLAALFGAGKEFDAFIAAFRIPNLLRDLFAEGALSAAFVTIFTQKLATEGEKSAWRLANLVLNALLIVVSALTVLGIWASPLLVRWINPGFAQYPGKTELTVTMTQIMFPFLLLVALAAQAMGLLNAKKKFGIPASASMMFNVGSILGGLGFAYWIDPHFGPYSVVGISIGTLIGGAAQLLIQLPSLRAVGFRYQPLLDFRDPGFRRVVKLVGPSVVGVAAVQINVFVNNWFASYFENGAVTWLNCAFRLMQFPIGLFGVAIATATLPAVAALVARGEIEEFRKTLGRSMRLAIFLSLPAACGLAVLAEPIIAVLYQHGRFSAYSTQQTAACLQAFAVGLAGYAALKVLAPTFYAFGDSRTPALVSLVSIALNALLCWLLAWRLGLGVMGLALSTGLVALANFVQLLFYMRRRVERIEGRALLRSAGKITLACAVMSWAALATHRFCAFDRYIDLVASVIAAVLVFGATCKLLRVAELGELLAVLRFGKKLHAAH